MSDMAPMKAYQGSFMMRREVMERGPTDRKADKRHKEGSRADERADRTILGKHKKARVSKGGVY